MDRKPGKVPDNSPKQIDRFKETARSLGCGEDEAAFDEKLKGIARQKPGGEQAPLTPRQDTPQAR